MAYSLNPSQEALLDEAVSSDAQKQILLQLFASAQKQSGADPWKMVANYVDDSPYGFSQWMRALLKFDAWLKHENRHDEIQLNAMLGYLCCCHEASGSPNTALPLEAVLDDMLNQYGYTGDKNTH